VCVHTHTHTCSGSWDKTLKVWDTEAWACVRTLFGHSAPVYGCGWSSADGGGRWIVSGSYDESLRVWDAESGVCVTSLLGHSRWVRCCQWSGACVCVGSGVGGGRWGVLVRCYQ